MDVLNYLFAALSAGEIDVPEFLSACNYAVQLVDEAVIYDKEKQYTYIAVCENEGVLS